MMCNSFEYQGLEYRVSMMQKIHVQTSARKRFFNSNDRQDSRRKSYLFSKGVGTNRFRACLPCRVHISPGPDEG